MDTFETDTVELGERVAWSLWFENTGNPFHRRCSIVWDAENARARRGDAWHD